MEKENSYVSDSFQMADTIAFMLNENNEFLAYTEEKLQDLILVSSGTLIWYREGYSPIELHSYSPGSMLDIIRQLYTTLRSALQGKLEYNMQQDIGYIHNPICADDPKAQHKNIQDFWKYDLWSSRSGTRTWLYNQQGKIFLEITLFYAWTPETIAAEEDDTLEAFRERMLNYKPLAIFEIPHEIAEQWYQQSKELITIIYRNFERDGGPHVDIETQI